MKNLAYWKGREIDAKRAYCQNATNEYRKAWLFAIAKVQRFEFNAFKVKGF